jgi:alpha-galactosidase/6-phospho-beta-glucosidase family protein
MVHPLVGSYPVARSILDDYLAAHGDLFPELA